MPHRVALLRTDCPAPSCVQYENITSGATMPGVLQDLKR